MASTYLTRTQGTPTNVDKGTISFWVKRGTLNKNNEYIIQNYIDGSNYGYIRWKSDNQLQVYSGGINDEKRTKMYFLDTTAWYHIVVRVDTSQGTANDRVRLYVNGEQISSSELDPNTNGGQNVDYDLFKSGGTMRIGYVSSGTATYFDGCLSHFHYCDGQSYAPTEFGETDSTTGEWKIKTSPSVSYGSQGFFILKDGNGITDQSPNSNDFTLGNGTLTKTEDCPSNIFNTFNVNVPSNSTTFSHGNTTLTSGSTQWNGAMTTIPLYGGKWYYECKYINGGNIKFDVTGEKSDYSHMATLNSSYGGYNDNGYGYQFNNSGNDYIGNNDSFPNWGGGLSSNTGDKIFMIALDLDNGKIWYGADGTWFNDASGNTGNPSAGTYAHQTISATHLAQKPFIVTGSLEGNSDVAHWNFGNGYFGTTAVSSAGNNASGIGIFEYDVPTGFTAISTKGLNE